ncbi:DDE superfamily endonuclease, partial [Phytophthora infestans]
YGADFRWRAVVLHYAYSVPCEAVSRIFRIAGRSARRRYELFKSTGHVVRDNRVRKKTYPPRLIYFITGYENEHPTLCRRVAVRAKKKHLFGLSWNVSHSIGEAGKRGCFSQNRDLHGKAPVLVSFVFLLLNVAGAFLAACDANGLVAWITTRGTFSRLDCHRALIQHFVRHLNPWSLPRSIVVLDNASIHMYTELEEAQHACDDMHRVLPPYCPQYNPIEVIIASSEVPMRACVKAEDSCFNRFRQCGYGIVGLNDEAFMENLGAM